MSEKLCVLGLGLMGSRVAKRLAAKRHHVIAWNRSSGPRTKEIASVARLASSPNEAVREASVVLLLLHDAKAVDDVLFCRGVVDSINPGALIVDMGTNTPETAHDVARLLPKSVRFADAPVSGGTKGAESGGLSIFLGAQKEDVALASEALGDLGTVTHMGTVGMGQAAKLANQIIVACAIAGLAEGFAFAGELGVNADTLRRAMAGGLADSQVLKTIGKRIVDGDFSPSGRAATHLKDLNCAFTQLNGAGALKATAAAHHYLQDIVRNFGDLDHAAMFLSARKTLGAKAGEKLSGASLVSDNVTSDEVMRL
ncbi:MAG TPA: NAD(P)-dependent oxidoreductase [Devosia sp.]|nr:NAD(P)-dependent oxidoreductase [Devosia sp.]